MKESLHKTLKDVQKAGRLPAVVAYNRIDGSGSSLDLREFQQTFWSLLRMPKNPEADPMAAWTRQLPRTVGITINVGTRVEARPFKPGFIAARSHDFKWRVSGQPGLIQERMAIFHTGHTRSRMASIQRMQFGKFALCQ